MVTQSLILALGIAAPAVSYTLLRARSRRFDPTLLHDNDSTMLLKAVDKTMNCHDKKKIGTIATLNRIWRTHPGIADPSQLPVLSVDNVRCSCEKWNLAQTCRIVDDRLRQMKVVSRGHTLASFPIFHLPQKPTY